MFADWTALHGKAYEETGEVFSRFNIFKSNVEYIYSHNKKGEHSYTLGLNEFSDMTHAEFRKMMVGGVRPNLNALSYADLPKDNVPESKDWRTEGAVTPVKNQGRCGSCWAFSTTGSIEGAWAIKNGTLPSLSEQELVDCAGSAGNQGCNGGLMDNAFKWIVGNGGLCSEADYPYTGSKSWLCHKKKCNSVARISAWKDVEPNNEDALKTAVAQQPVSIAIEADHPDFQHYKDGVFSDNCGTQLDHGVLIAGYGNDPEGGDYWIVKNSWGASWGKDGYILIQRGTNECGISQSASYPIV